MLRAFLLVVVICGLGCDDEGASPDHAVSAEAWADALARMEALERDLAAAQDALSAVEASQAAAGMQLTDLAAADAAATARLNTLEARDVALLIDEPLTMDVPADHDTLADAMDWLQDKVLAARVTIRIADGTYMHTEGINLGHRDGARIRIEGNNDDPSTVVLAFDGAEDGLYLTRGGVIDGISGFTLRGAGEMDTSVGLYVGEGSVLRCRGPIVVERFAEGVMANYGSSLRCDGLVSQQNRFDGVVATRSSILRAYGATVRDNGGNGFQANYGSVIDAREAQSIDNGSEQWHAGFSARLGSVVEARAARSTGGSGSGFAANGASSVSASGATASGNGRAGWDVTGASYGEATNGATSMGNQSGLRAMDTSSLVTWGGVTVTANTSAGVDVGGNSSVDLQGATIRENLGDFGVNSFWGSFVHVGGATIAGHRYDTNMTPSTEGARNADVYTY